MRTLLREASAPEGVAVPARSVARGGGEPVAGDERDFLMRRGRPSWGDNDWRGLLQTLQHAGYGWLRPDGVRRELERMKAQWQGPPPVPWEQNA